MNFLTSFWSKRTGKQRITIIVLLGLVILGVIGNLLPSSKGDQGLTNEPSGAAVETRTFDSAGCLRVSEELVKAIGQGFTGSKLTGNAAGFKASDFADVKFVAVEFIPNGDTDVQHAVFATNDDDLGNVTLNGIIVPVDGFAKQFSDWGVAPKLNLSIADAGADESIECLSLPGAGLADQEAGLEGFDEAKFLNTAKTKYGTVDETYDDGSTLTVMELARTICESGDVSTMKKNLGGEWSTSFNKFAIETLCPEKLK